MTFSLSGFSHDYYERWGLNDPKVRRRVWARVPEIIFQEVPAWPLYATFVGIGANSLAAFALSILGYLFLFNSPVIYDCLWWPLSSSVGLFASGLVAKPLGGKFWAIPIFMTAICQAVAFSTNVVRLYFADKLPAIGEGPRDTLVLCLSMGILYFILFPIFAAAGADQFESYRLTSAHKLLESGSPIPVLPLSHTVGVSPLSVFTLVVTESIYALLSLSQSSSIGNMLLKDVLNVIVLILSAIITVNSVIASLVAGKYAWHWRAFSTTAIPAVILHAVVVVATALISGTEGHGSRVCSAFLRVCEIGAAGSLGAYFALQNAQQYVYNEHELKEVYERLVIPRPKKVEEAERADKDTKVVSDASTDTYVSVQAE